MKIITLIFALLFTAGAAAAASVWYIFRDKTTSSSDLAVELSIAGPTKITSGEENTLEIQYKNRTKITLKNVNLIIKYSNGFVGLETDKPTERQIKEGAKELSWKQKNLPGESAGTLTLKATAIATKDSPQFITAELFYTPENFSSEFKKTARQDFTIENSSIEFNLSGPQEVSLEDEVTYVLEYENNSEKDLEGVRFQWHLPKHLVVIRSTPNPKEEQIFEVPKLPSGKNGKISITGRFNQLAFESFPITADLFTAYNGKFFLERTETLPITLKTKGIMEVNLLVNGSSESTPASFGHTLDFSFIYENQSGRDLSHLKIIAAIETSAKDLLEVEKLAENYESKKEKQKNLLTLTWSEENNPKLAKLGYGERSALNFSIPIAGREFLETVTREEGESLNIKSFLSIEIPSEPQTKSEDEEKEKKRTDAMKITSKVFTTLINSDLIMNREITGYGAPSENPELMSYEMKYTIENSLHEINKLSLTIPLPSAAKWLDRSILNAGNIFFNDATRTILWDLNRLPNSLSEPLEIRFSVGIPVGLVNVGQDIVEESTLLCADTVTKALLTITLPSVNTKSIEK
jgi:hypothetical protein